MSDPIGTYTFLPWLRIGVANDQAAASAGSTRATVDVSVEVRGANVGGGTTTTDMTRTVELYGPGDVIGVDSAQISRVEPAHWTTNFEPNYLAAIELYDEDFPWRYTPATPDGKKLLPWLALVVLEESTEFRDVSAVQGRPLPSIEVTADFAAVLPIADEAWAWAHAHFNGELSPSIVDEDAARVAGAAQRVMDTARDTACARILCPRKLKPKTSYHAFLVPAFESGRLAGLGEDPVAIVADTANGLTATSSAWAPYATPANRPSPTHFPFYYRWYFRTADNGDFESLVRLLRPKVVDPRVGYRDIDVTAPAPNVTGILDPALGGVLRLGGALRAPLPPLGTPQRDELERYERWATPYPHVFQRELAAFVNLADGYRAVGPSANEGAALHEDVRDDPDPLVTPPLYGRWHALTERLLEARDGSPVVPDTGWVHELNLDPRWRVAAGLGTAVVQKDQEAFVAAAWEQVGDVLEANRRIRQAQLAKIAGARLHAAHVAPAARVSAGALMMLTAPLSARVLSQGLTVRHRVKQSALGVTLTSSALRRAIRPRGKIAKHLRLDAVTARGELVERVNGGQISAAPPRTPPKDILTPDALADAAASADGENVAAIEGTLLFLLVVLVLSLAFGPIGWIVAALALLALVILWKRYRPALDRRAVAERLKESSMVPATVDRMPGSASFTLVSHVDTSAPVVPRSVGPREVDNAEAARFKQSIRAQYGVIQASARVGAVPPPVALDTRAVAVDVVAGVRPSITVPRWILSGIAIPDRVRAQMGEAFTEVMAYPEIDLPMYEPLARQGSELLVPNLHLVEPDSVTLLETNQPFIEAYMVGLNHEMARELLWREYPTDQRGSTFRQFWDVRQKLAEATDREAAREALKDIAPIHRWSPPSALGDHDNRDGGTRRAEVVLVIRGELLKKYPNAVISAHRARWQLTGGVPDKSKERVLDPASEPVVPLYEARVSPDIYFFGFALTADEARGDDRVDDRPGWFFRIEEVPGDARFGFDIAREEGSTIHVWNDLAWADVAPALPDGGVLRASAIPARTLVEPTGSDVEKHDQWEMDRQVQLDVNVSSAELAYIALQTPVIMAVHAAELLPDQEGT